MSHTVKPCSSPCGRVDHTPCLGQTRTSAAHKNNSGFPLGLKIRRAQVQVDIFLGHQDQGVNQMPMNCGATLPKSGTETEIENARHTGLELERLMLETGKL